MNKIIITGMMFLGIAMIAAFGSILYLMLEMIDFNPVAVGITAVLITGGVLVGLGILFGD